MLGVIRTDVKLPGPNLNRYKTAKMSVLHYFVSCLYALILYCFLQLVFDTCKLQYAASYSRKSYSVPVFSLLGYTFIY